MGSGKAEIYALRLYLSSPKCFLPLFLGLTTLEGLEAALQAGIHVWAWRSGAQLFSWAICLNSELKRAAQ